MKSVTFDNSRGFALGFDEAAPSPFVTWQFTETENGQKDYYWGHYHSSGQTAEKDFAKRVADYKELFGVHIELYRAACADFKAILGGAKLPKMDTLKEEGRKLAEQKKKLYAEYRKAKADMQEVTTIKANIDYLLGYSEPGRKKEQEF